MGAGTHSPWIIDGAGLGGWALNSHVMVRTGWPGQLSRAFDRGNLDLRHTSQDAAPAGPGIPHRRTGCKKKAKAK